MAKFAQFEEENPIIRDQKVASKAEGFEQLAKATGQISDEVTKQAISLGEEKSNANLLSAHSTLQQLNNSTRAQLEENPANSDTILQQAKESVQSILSNSFVNEKDKPQLRYLADGITNQLEFDGSKKKVELQRNQLEYQQTQEFDNNLQGFFNLAFTDPKAADILSHNIEKSIQINLGNGVYTPAKANQLYVKLLGEKKRALDRGALLNDPNASAATFNAVNSYQPSPSPDANANSLVDEHTRFFANHFLSNMSSADVKAYIDGGGYVTPNQTKDLSVDKVRFYNGYMQGAALAQGKITATASWYELKQEQKRLNAQEQGSLGSVDQGKRGRINNWIAGIENGKFFDYVSQTRDGIAARQEWQMRSDSIDKNQYLTMSPEGASNQRKLDKAAAMNEYYHRLQAIGHGMNIPDEYRNYIPSNIVEPIMQGFSKGEDPVNPIQSINILDKSNLNQLVNQTKDPRQGLVVKHTGLLFGNSDPGFVVTLWKANQDGVDTTALEPKTDKDNRLTDQKIVDKLHGDTRFVDMQNQFRFHPNGAQYMSGLSKEAVRYVKYRGLMDGDYSLSHVDQYVDEFNSNVSRASNIVSSFNYNFDKNLIPFENENQAASYANYALQKTYTKMLDYMNPQQLEEYISKNQPYVINDPYGNIAVVNRYNEVIPDKDRNAAFREPYNLTTQHIADEDAAKRFEENVKLTTNPFMTKLTYLGGNNYKIGDVFSHAPRIANEPEVAAEVPRQPLPKSPVQEAPQTRLQQTDAELKGKKEMPYGVTQADIDRVNALPLHIRNGKDTKNFRNALKPFMHDDSHKHMSEAELEKELQELRSGNFTRSGKGKKK